MSRMCGAFVLAGLTVIASPAAATPADDRASEPRAQATVAVQQVHLPLPGLREEVAMVLVGTVLIGVGAAVRRAA